MESGLAQRRGGGLAWSWVVIGAAACAAMTPLEPSLLEEGVLVHFAQRMLDGERLYRDLVFFSGPLPFEGLALLFRVFGEEIAVGRAALAVLAGLASGAVFSLAVRAGSGAMAWPAAACVAAAPILLFPFFSTYFYTTLAMHGSVLAAYAALRGVRSPGWAALAGVAVACVALSKQSVGGVAAVGLFAVLAGASEPGLRLRRCASMLAGAGGVALATFALYALRGDLGPLVDALVFVPLSLESTFSSPSVNYWPIGSFDPEVQRNQAFYVPHLLRLLTGEGSEVGSGWVAVTQALYALPWLALALPVVWRWRIGPLPTAVWVHEIVLLAGIANLWPRADWGHLVFALPAAASQLLITISAGSSRPERPHGSAVIRLSAAGLVAAILTAACAIGVALYRLAEPSRLGPRVPQQAVSRAYRDPGLVRVVRFLRQHTTEGEPVFMARAEPLLYFATDTRNPTPYPGILPSRRDEQSQRILAALDGVRYVVMSEIDQPFFLYYRDELPEVQAYLERFFHVAAVYERRPSWIVVLERGTDRGQTQLDLFDEQSSARAWLRDAAGRMILRDATPPKLATRANRRPLPIVVGAGGGGLDYEIDVPPNAWFHAGIGLARVDAPNGPRTHVRGARLELALREGSGPFETLASQPVPMERGAGTRWTPLEVDLGPYAGRRVTLRLQVMGAAPLRPGALAWWGSPVIVVR